MAKNKRPIYIYFPIVFSIVLILGIVIGMKMAGVRFYNQNILNFSPAKSSKIINVIDYISQDYVDSVNKNELIEESINKMLKNLDPHSVYISAEDFNLVNDPLLSNFEGIGVEFRIVKDTITVIHAIPGGPSEKVGIRGGDRIVMIEDSLVAGTGIESRDAMRLLKGKRGTKVNVGVFRRHVDDLIDFEITRDVIPTYSIDIAYMVDDSVGYIKVSKFAENTYEEFTRALDLLDEKGMKKLILDLRGNVGGYLNAAIKMADEFLENDKLIVYTEGNSRPRNYAYATSNGEFEDTELIILLDEGSASASEVLAGAIQDNDRGLIIGRRSFGKGLVQEQIQFSDGSAMRLTVARYYTPTGRCIQKSYKDGYEDYYHEYYERFLNGEMEHKDSIHFNDSLKYITPGGKIVYGGGGIMPDVYVPVASDDNEFYNELVRRGTLFQFAFNYTDEFREDLSRFDSFEHYQNSFKLSDENFDKLIKYAEEKGVKASREEIADSRDRIEILIKAYIGQNVYNDAGFYPIYHQIDHVFQKAMETLAKN